MKFTTKAQTETIGFILVVIIVVLVIFFVLLSKKSFDDKNNIIDSQLSQSMLNTLLQVNTGCGPSFSVIIQDCFNDNSFCRRLCYDSS